MNIDVDIDSLADDIALLATHIDAATQRLLEKLRAFDSADGWARQGALSCAHWLSWRIGMGLGAAREKLRVAHKLAELPAIDAAFGAGQISYSKVRAMTRVATAENEQTLLDMARQTTAAQLEKICRLYRGVIRLDEPAASFETCERFLRSRDTDDGMVSIQIKLLPDEAARFMAAAEACADDGTLADGAVHMAESALLGGRDRDIVRPPVEAVVHICAETLEGHTDDGHGVPAETSRRILCDAGVVPMLEDGAGAALDVGRKTRSIPAAMRRALRARDGGCRFPGCDHRRFVDAHHVEHWIDGGTTELSNLITLCRRHHRYLHEWGYSMQGGDEGVEFFGPDGVRAVAQDVRPTLTPSAAREVAIEVEVSEPGWDGWPIDYPMCVEALAS